MAASRHPERQRPRRRIPGLRLALVVAIDLGWWLLLEQLVAPLLLPLLGRPESAGNRLLDDQLAPMLWSGYGLLYAGQLWWLQVVARRRASGEAGRRWWQGLAVLSVLTLALRWWWLWRLEGVLPWPAEAFLVLLQAIDLVVIYWLPTAVLARPPLQRAVPGWPALTLLRWW